MDIWFWQRIISPHMAGLAGALAEQGHTVTYVAEVPMSVSRARQGWSVPEMAGVSVKLAPTDADVVSLVHSAADDSVHICQGIRSNGRVARAQCALANRHLRQWLIMETVDDSGWRGIVKRLVYSKAFRTRSQSIEGVLAIGAATPAWVVSRGVSPDRVFPFAYFISDSGIVSQRRVAENSCFRIIFAGRLVELKRVDMLIDAVSALMPGNAELVIVGSGPEEDSLKRRATMKGADSGWVQWLGQATMHVTRREIAKADCLVLPSRQDGWGAVVSEALISGTPAICSDTCGSAVVVRASGVGAVFRSGDLHDLQTCLEEAVSRGPITLSERRRIAEWAACLKATEGARYLERILRYRNGATSRPMPPWEAMHR